MAHQTLGRWVFCPSNPLTQCIILKIVGFQSLCFFKYHVIFSHAFLTKKAKSLVFPVLIWPYMWLLITLNWSTYLPETHLGRFLAGHWLLCHWWTTILYIVPWPSTGSKHFGSFEIILQQPIINRYVQSMKELLCRQKI